MEGASLQNIAMAAAPLHRSIICFVLLLLPFAFGRSGTLDDSQTWCVAKPSSEKIRLQNNIDYACSKVDCAPIAKDGPCFYPDSTISHASVAMNLHYQSNGRNDWTCFFNDTGLIVITDPSYGNCKYA